MRTEQTERETCIALIERLVLALERIAGHERIYQETASYIEAKGGLDDALNAVDGLCQNNQAYDALFARIEAGRGILVRRADGVRTDIDGFVFPPDIGPDGKSPGFSILPNGGGS